MLILGIGSATALYISGMTFSGSVLATGGEEPTAQEYTWDINITSNDNQTKTFQYDNQDGPQTFKFDIDTSDICSTSAICTYEENRDLRFVIEKNIWDSWPLSESEQPEIYFEPGTNTFSITTLPHPNRCPLAGNISMTATLI